MSTTANAVAPGAPPAKKSGKKKLLIVALAAVVLLVLAAGVAVWLLRGQAQADDTDEGASAHGTAAARHAKGAPPVFMPLDPFTVNLADKDTDRYAQIAVTLELEDSHFGDQLRQYLPAIRNNILMALAQKTAAELLTPEGKEKLARQIQRETLRPLGISVDDPADDAADDPTRKKTRHRKAAPPAYPVRSVQFASFIIQ